MLYNPWIRFVLPVCLATGGGVGAADTPGVENVVLMVADGAGYNAWRATAMYEGALDGEFRAADGWVRLAAATHALRPTPEAPVSAEHLETQFPALVYDPVRAWDPRRVEGRRGPYPFHFAGYEWLITTAPDSANTITAMTGGRKTYVGGINFDGASRPIEDTLARLAHDRGKRVGVVSSVMFAHATPAAAAGAHAALRSNYCELAVEILTAPYPDVVAGCGNPDFDNNGRRLEEDEPRQYRFVGGKEIWERLNGAGSLSAGQRVCAPPDSVDEDAGQLLSAGQIEALGRWTLKQSRRDVESLQRGRTPDKLLILPEVGASRFWSGVPAAGSHFPRSKWVGGTLQQQRGSRADPRFTDPGYDPPLPGVPSLTTMTRAALNALDDGEGFFLHVEGGAVDWAMHANQAGRMVEEMIDFKRSIEAVIEWVEGHGGWDRTLLIVTADHDHMLWGPNSDRIPFDALQDMGQGRLPAYRWLSDGHSNALVPVFARGPGSGSLAEHTRGDDPFYGPYIDQTDIYTLIKAVLK